MDNPQGKSSGKEFYAWLLIGLLIFSLMVIFLPAYIGARAIRSPNPCINNLRQIDAAANQFALVNSLTNGSPIHFPNDLTPYIKLTSGGKIPSCPLGGSYSINKVGGIPTCSLGTTVTPAHVLQ